MFMNRLVIAAAHGMILDKIKRLFPAVRAYLLPDTSVGEVTCVRTVQPTHFEIHENFACSDERERNIRLKSLLQTYMENQRVLQCSKPEEP